MHIYIWLIAIPDEFAFKIEASDVENDTLTFTLSGPNARHFKVEPNTGRVFISEPLDREVCPLYYFIL